jgi:hypothetical protein
MQLLVVQFCMLCATISASYGCYACLQHTQAKHKLLSTHDHHALIVLQLTRWRMTTNSCSNTLKVGLPFDRGSSMRTFRLRVYPTPCLTHACSCCWPGQQVTRQSCCWRVGRKKRFSPGKMSLSEACSSKSPCYA